MKFRLYYEELGGHTHVSMFAGEGLFSLGKCGDLTFRNEEWREFRDLLIQHNPTIEIFPEKRNNHESTNRTC